MKIIDLLNKIANREEVPYKVKYNGIIFTYNSSNKQGLKYVDLNEENEVFYRYLTGVVNKLTDEVEIIEEQHDIDIQSIEEIKDIFIENSTCGEDVKYLARKYNEISKAVKQLDKKIKEER